MVSGARHAYADSAPAPLELAWEAAEGCPDATFVVQRVEQILRAPPTIPGGVMARGVLQKTGDAHFELELTIRADEAEDTRTIEGTSCAALAEAAAVAISLAIDPTRASPSRERETPAAVAPAPEAPPLARLVAKGEREPLAPPNRVALGVGSAIGSGSLPRLGAGIFASAALDLRRFRVGALGAFSFRQRPVFEPALGAGASFDTFAVGIFGAYMVPLGPFAFGPAANLELTYMRVEGFGIRSPKSAWTAWPTGVLGARCELDLARRVRAVARADVLLPVDTPIVILGAPGSKQYLYEPERVALRFSFGAEIVLP
ncbi:hypothetical protein AKJ09_08007 [Labilithrix luteola]|uniref:Uncharacterized protein n=1 Tax=Labilithrix luteola TaxID=1391654 RepID=A0A0K1Q6K4_9BACT|nr:hypothetical protein AKJ09_08007 [Labilithrix luteola]